MVLVSQEREDAASVTVTTIWWEQFQREASKETAKASALDLLTSGQSLVRVSLPI